MVYLTGTATENPLPPGKMDDQLAEDFAEFFMNKIQTIRDSLAKSHHCIDPNLQISQNLMHSKNLEKGT